MVEPTVWVMSADLYRSYTTWAGENGITRPMSQGELAGRLKERGLTNTRETRGPNKGKKKWVDIGLRNE